MNLDLFQTEPPPADLDDALPVEVPPLRDYQRQAVESVRRELETNRGTLVLLATGLGKTQVACDLIRTWRGRACFIAHRGELITQAANRIEQFTGAPPQIEKAEHRANLDDDTPVVASIQSLAREKRIERYPRDAFSLIIVDEVHHATAGSYRAVIDYFSTAKIVGLTATPDRLDGEALGQVLDSVAMSYEMVEAIADGWLAPIKMRAVKVDGIDFTKVRTTAGDFNQGDLDALMAREEALHGVAKPAVDLSGERPTIVFTTSIENAHRLAEIINRYKGRDAAVAVDSTLDDEERKKSFRLFESGQRQFLVNVGIATEGYDYPPTACVVMGRPTKSRALYVQMVGRGTRGGPKCPIPGKADCLVLDFVGGTERHDIVSAVDALAGDVSDEEAKLIKAQVREAQRELSIDEARQLAEAAARKKAEADEAARAKRSGLKAQVSYRDFDPNPYVSLGVKRDFGAERYGWAEATDAQKGYLQKALGNKYADALPQKLGKREASRLIGEISKRRESGKCTLAQMYALQKRGVNAKEFSFEAAHRVLDAFAKNAWKPLPPDQVAELARE